MTMKPIAMILAGAAAALLAVSPLRSQTVTSEVFDPAEDFLSHGNGDGARNSYQDIVHAAITQSGGLFVFGLTVAAERPEGAPLRGGRTMEHWSWLLDTNLQTFPAGYPLAGGLASDSEFIVEVAWDGTLLTGDVIDRRPLVVGEEATVTPILFTVSGRNIVGIVDASLIGSPATFVWSAATEECTSHMGTGSMFDIDRTASAVFSVPGTGGSGGAGDHPRR